MKHIFTLFCVIGITCSVFAQSTIYSITPSYGYQSENLDVSIVGGSGLSYATHSYGYLYQASQASNAISFYLQQGSSIQSPGLIQFISNIGIPSTIDPGTYTLRIGSATLNNAFYINYNAAGSGVINGTLNQGTPKTGAPLVNYRLILNDMNSSNVFYSFSDSSGYFEFRHLPNGIYELTGTGVTQPVIYEIGRRTQYNGQTVELTNTGLEVVGIADPTELNSLTCYPTMITDKLTVDYDLKVSSNVEIEIYDLAGHQLYHATDDQAQAGNNIHSVDASTFPAASIYILKVTINNRSTTRKLIKAQ